MLHRASLWRKTHLGQEKLERTDGDVRKEKNLHWGHQVYILQQMNKGQFVAQLSENWDGADPLRGALSYKWLTAERHSSVKSF